MERHLRDADISCLGNCGRTMFGGYWPSKTAFCMDDFRWIATLSNGETAVEHSGEWQIKPGTRKPWVRLCEFCTDNNLKLTSLRLWFRGKTIHMPRDKFDKFSMNDTALPPNHYSLQYHIEADDILSGVKQDTFIDLAAHYEDFIVHYIQDVSEGSNSWMVVTRPHQRLAASPK
jgi:hypothetical protein